MCPPPATEAGVTTPGGPTPGGPAPGGTGAGGLEAAAEAGRLESGLAAPVTGAAATGPALVAPAAFEQLLVAMSRHLPETDAAGEQLLRRTLAWLSRRAPSAGARASAAAREALECGLSAAQTLADL